MKTVPTIEQQTGWSRPENAPLMICQDPDVLDKVTQHNFDLDDPAFIEYHKSRTGICIGQEQLPELSRFLLLSPDAENWLLTSPDLKTINDKYGNMLPPEQWIMVPMDSPDRHFEVTATRRMKARLQDSWELFILKGMPSLAVPGVDHNAI